MGHLITFERHNFPVKYNFNLHIKYLLSILDSDVSPFFTSHLLYPYACTYVCLPTRNFLYIRGSNTLVKIFLSNTTESACTCVKIRDSSKTNDESFVGIAYSKEALTKMLGNLNTPTKLRF